MAVLLPGGCVMPEDGPEPARTSLPRVVTVEPVRPVEGTWSFSFANGVCTASVSHPSAGVTISAGPTSVLRVVARLAPMPGRGAASSVAFSGPGGAWTSRLRRQGGTASSSSPLNAAAEGRLRALLAGGTLRLTTGNTPLAVLTVPDSGVAGRDWFGCVSQLGV